MANKRLFYGCQGVALAGDGSVSPVRVKGLQSMSMTTTFNLEPVNEYGQTETYENIEGIPEVSVQLEKVVDGSCPLLLLATQGAGDSTLVGRSNQRASLYLSIFNDTQSFASGSPVSALWCSGMYWSASSFTLPVDGNYTESLTLLGAHKKWFATPADTPFDGVTGFGPTAESPPAITGSGGVNRREDMMFIYNDVNFAVPDSNGNVISSKGTVLPSNLPGIGPSGMNLKSNGQDFNCHVGDISVSVDAGREQIFEQGRRLHYHRYVQIPVTVSCDINVTATSGDNVDVLEEGGVNGAPAGSLLNENTIKIVTREGLIIDLGTKNKLQNVQYQGGDTGGGNVTLTYTYNNQNTYTIKHTADVTTALKIPQQNWTSGSQGSTT